MNNFLLLKFYINYNLCLDIAALKTSGRCCPYQAENRLWLLVLAADLLRHIVKYFGTVVVKITSLKERSDTLEAKIVITAH